MSFQGPVPLQQSLTKNWN